MIKLLDIFKVYFLIGIQLIGGGYVIFPLLKKYLVEDKKWMKEEDLINYLALSQCLPGIIALNISIFSSYQLRKIKGTLAAVTGLLLPSFLIIVLVASFIFNIADNKYIQNAFYGIRLSVIVLIFYMIKDIFQKSVNSAFSYFIFFLILFLSFFAGVSPTTLVIITILLAVIKGYKK